MAKGKAAGASSIRREKRSAGVLEYLFLRRALGAIGRKEKKHFTTKRKRRKAK